MATKTSWARYFEPVLLFAWIVGKLQVDMRSYLEHRCEFRMVLLLVATAYLLQYGHTSFMPSEHAPSRSCDWIEG